MHKHGILSIPDFIANAGGVICAAVEYHGGNQEQALATIEEKIRLSHHVVHNNGTPEELYAELSRVFFP